MAEGIGQVQFFTSIINYIVLFTSIGIPLYGIREIARVRDNEEVLSRTTVEILSLNLFLNVFGYLAVILLCTSVNRIQENIPLFLILSSSIVLNSLGCSWFYSGIEEFKYITIRGLCIKIVCVVYLFLAVKTQDDLLYYAFYTVIGSIGNNVLNFVRLRKHISIRVIQFSKFDLFRHVKPAFAIFILNLVTSIYLNLDKVMLGFIQNDEAVGYYTASSNLSHTLLYVVISVGTVLLPRSSNLIQNNRMDEFAALSNKAYHFVVLMALPIALGCICLAEPMVLLFAGDGFAPSILSLQILSPIIIFIGISNIIGLQVLYPLGRMRIITISTCVGAVVNLILNGILIPVYSHYGASVATVIAEFSVVLTQILMTRKFLPFKVFDRQIMNCIISVILMFVVIMSVSHFITNAFLKILLIPILGALVYGSALLIFKDSFLIEMISSLKLIIRKS